MPKTLEQYADPNGNDPFEKWIMALRDARARAVINLRLRRVEETGNFGECRPVGEGVHEFIIDFGPGYRVYFGNDAQGHPGVRYKESKN
jgi:putative addiction module killer protein